MYKTLVCGGSYNKPSGVVRKLANELNGEVEIINGFTDLPTSSKADRIIWMVDIPNEEPKHYIRKSRGAVLICSKFMHDGVTTIDAVSRIFKMHGNAVICIYKDSDRFSFKLVDALGVVWYNGYHIDELVYAINRFTNKCKASVRYSSFCKDLDRADMLDDYTKSRLDMFITLNNKLKDKIQTSCGERFFGNISTRCSKLFPTCNSNGGIWVSPRNVSKEMIISDDMVLVEDAGDHIEYDGVKPSIDAPVQVKCYNARPYVNYMIHGHANIIGAETTKNYYFCGDMREVDGIVELINNSSGYLNLKNHGFIIYSSILDELEDIINNVSFEYIINKE